MKHRILLALISSVAFTGLVRADAAKPTYADDVLPILKQACVSCHSADKQKGGLDVSTFAALMQGGSSGVVVTAGQPEKSRLYTLAAHTEEPKMPPKADKLAAANLDLFRKWIEQGARENSGSKMVAPPKPAANVALATAVKGRPEGPPPMPGKLPLEPAVVARRTGTVTALASNPWAPVVAVGGAKQILLYHTDSGDLLGVLPFSAGHVHSLRFSRNGKLLLAAGGRGGQSGKAILYDLTTGKIVTEVGQETDVILSADLSSDQSQIAVGSPAKIVRVYATKDGSVLHEIKKHTDWVTAVEFSPDGVLLASGDRNGGLFVWEASTGREFYALRGPTAAITDVSWRDDANSVAASSEDGTVRTFEMENGTQTKSWGAHGGGAASVKYTHDGRLASTGRDRVTKLWDANGAVQKQFEAFPDLGLRVAVSHDNARVIAGDWSGQVRVWTVADAKLQTALDANPPPTAERLKRAEAAVVEGEKALKAANDAVVAAKAAADKANANAASFQKEANDAAAATKTAQDSLAAQKAELEKQSAAIVAAQTAEAARAVTKQALDEAVAKVQDAAAKQPQNAELKGQATHVVSLAQAAAAELESAKKKVANSIANRKATADALAAREKAMADLAATQATRLQKLKVILDTAKPAQDALVAAQARAAAAQAELEKAKKKLAREKDEASKR